MKDATPRTVYLKDYTPFSHSVESVHLTVRLHPTQTRVISRIRFVPRDGATLLDLHGEGLRLISALIDGQPVTPELTDDGLRCPCPAVPFDWEAEVEIAPAENTALEGLYMSNGMYCTQCEAEGFRKITYYPDRPDVMAPFTVRIEAPEGGLPVLLSNGNPQGAGDGWAEWHDPWPKPAYLFALVAGDLVAFPDSFTTASGREVALNIWVRPGDEGKCAWGMEAIKASMRWDETTYGREYDLDVFNVVAVDDFNMGAMENKGLNIFNSSCVLASPETATDANFERIESIVAHEYFHNWTGNRITCRDWFQLCLKEGLTVFRDQQFTADHRSAAVKRIEDVAMLRARQFPEDQGPLAHPVRPSSFQEINNFYTATVYEKGAELIRMLRLLVGAQGYDAALALYFARHDGDAATIEDWIQVFEDATGRDLSQFARWYAQAGTPRLRVQEAWHAEEGRYTLTVEQHTPPTPGQPDKAPLLMPLAVGLLAPDGSEAAPTQILELSQPRQSFEFTGLAARPVPSILREFSAPVVLDRDNNREERVFLLAHDTDPFNRWEASRQLARDSLIAMITDDAGPDEAWLDALERCLRDTGQDRAYRALLMGLPSQSELAQTLFDRGVTPDPDRIWQAVESLQQQRAERWQDLLPRLIGEGQVQGAYRPDAEQSGQRALAGAALALLSRLDGGLAARAQFNAADNMTLSLSALSCLMRAGAAQDALTTFETRWREDRLVMDKWFALQVAMAAPAEAVDNARALTEHPDFRMENPNRFRAVFGALAGHHAGFHRADGAGYGLLADWLIRLDGRNPQTAARMMSAFQTWRRYDAARQAAARAALERIQARDGLSRDSREMVGRLLDG